MTNKEKIEAIQNRINLLQARKTYNGPIVAKLNRKIRMLEKKGDSE